jgi:hypothetical protein
VISDKRFSTTEVSKNKKSEERGRLGIILWRIHIIHPPKRSLPAATNYYPSYDRHRQLP